MFSRDVPAHFYDEIVEKREEIEMLKKYLYFSIRVMLFPLWIAKWLFMPILWIVITVVNVVGSSLLGINDGLKHLGY